MKRTRLEELEKRVLALEELTRELSRRLGELEIESREDQKKAVEELRLFNEGLNNIMSYGVSYGQAHES